MKKYRYYIPIVVLFVVLCLFIYVQKVKYERNIRSLNDVSTKLVNMSNFNDSLQMNLSKRSNIRAIELANQGKEINTNIPLQSDGTHALVLGEIIKKNDLVFVFSKNNYCKTCIDLQLELISEVFKEDAENKIKIFANNYTKDDLKVLKDTLNLNFEIYGILNDDLVLLGNSQSFPFYFRVDEGFKMKDIFIPAGDMKELSRNYLRNQIRG
ncbi:hypothetical protein [Zhouia amylolytica]|uniref:hypothetical protein n=1 Tax=Zhouia amylolytica TaxID=376730 RepID=UPI0020CF7E83|nr:hypothetical protein [Zhouia amylolytica]MCQ0110917.1 hypothetical protein [Zhouia amylolytica]